MTVVRRVVGVTVDRGWPVFRLSRLEDADPEGREVQHFCSLFQAAVDENDRDRTQPSAVAGTRVRLLDHAEALRSVAHRPESVRAGVQLTHSYCLELSHDLRAAAGVTFVNAQTVVDVGELLADPNSPRSLALVSILETAVAEAISLVVTSPDTEPDYSGIVVKAIEYVRGDASFEELCHPDDLGEDA